MKRALVVILTAGTLAMAPASIAPAQAAGFTGFTTSATATPLKIEVFEPAIPIPAEPQMELNFSYTRVDGASGPIGDARASAMWPGDSVGEGWKTIGDQLGLPAQLTKDGYPVQVNAQSPGDHTQAAQEPLPGMVTRASATDKKAIAKAGYSAGGDVPEGQLDGESRPTDPLKALSGGDLSALGNALTGSATGSTDDPRSTSPLGALGALVDPSGMSSVSTTDYSGDEVVANATSRLGELSLIGGLVKLTGLEVVARTTSNLAAGARTTSRVTFGGLTIAGQQFAMTKEGIEGGGQTSPIPGLPADPTDALKALGISFDLPAPRVIKDGAHGGVALEGLRVTIDTQPLRSKLPALPLADLINQMPEQAGQLKSLLLALTEAHPRFVVSLGAVTTEATTVAGIDLGADSAPPAGATTGGAGSPGTAGTAAVAGSPGEVAPGTAGVPVASTALRPVSAVPGLPPMGSIPGLLGLLGALLAGGAGWYLRRAGGLLFGAGSTCSHGLKAGVPDLRKA